jgi:hypothetical protein
MMDVLQADLGNHSTLRILDLAEANHVLDEQYPAAKPRRLFDEQLDILQV